MSEKRRALVTGASAGIGEELAKLFAKDGIDLILVARRKERLEALAADLEKEFGIDVQVIPADLADPAAPDALFEELQSRDLQVDYLVNNAGFGTNGRFWELDAGREVDQVHVNVVSLVHLTRLVLPGMVERGFGRVLNIASTAGFQPGPFMATYYATKAFVISFTQAIAFELKATGVTATAHCPGATESEFADVAGSANSNLFQRQKPASSQDVARDAYGAMKAGKAIRVQGAMNRVGAFMTRFSRSASIAVAAKMNEEA